MKLHPSGTFAPVALSDINDIWRACLDLSWQAFANGSLPIGAVIVDGHGKIIASGRNRLGEPHEHSPHLPGTPYLTGSPLAHAEVNAILQMGNNRPAPRPTIYTTVEPCPLCIGAARMAGLGHVAFAARDAWAGSAEIADTAPYLQRLGPTTSGPEPQLEPYVVTWLLASIQQDSVDWNDVWSTQSPSALGAAQELMRTGRLSRTSNLEEVWDALTAALAQVD